MEEVARQALSKLLTFAENARGKESAEGRTIGLKFSSASFPAYLEIASHAQKEQCHGELLVAQAAGAIAIDWDRRAGVHGQVTGIKLLDGDILAERLCVVPRWRAHQGALQRLEGFGSIYPVLEDVLQSWQLGKTVRGTRAQDVDDWVDACRVLECCQARADEQMIRPLSIELFADSKRIESLLPLLDVLECAQISALPRSADEIMGCLGLQHFPREWMMAGDIRLNTLGRWSECPLPYVACSAEAVKQFDGDGFVRTILTIENKQTFWELARIRTQGGALLVYTGGMPGPSWRRAFAKLLSALPGASVHHWGDIDAGGFRIANLIAQDCHSLGRTLELHQMASPKTRHDSLIQRKTLSNAECAQIESICNRWDWHEERNWVLENRVAIEQEHLLPSFP